MSVVKKENRKLHKEEIYAPTEGEKYCSFCGLPVNEMSDTEDSELLETRTLKNLSLRGLSISHGSVGDGLKRSAQVIEDHFGIIANGILLVDRYSACKLYAKKPEGLTLVFCWAHARRTFRDAGLKYEKVKKWVD